MRKGNIEKMRGYHKFELNDVKDIEKLNNLLNPAGISFENNLFAVYVLINVDQYKSVTGAIPDGRRTTRRKATSAKRVS